MVELGSIVVGKLVLGLLTEAARALVWSAVFVLILNRWAKVD